MTQVLSSRPKRRFRCRIRIALMLLFGFAPLFATTPPELAKPTEQKDEGCREQGVQRRHSLQELADEANKHTFANILAGNPAAVCNIEEIFEVTSQTELKERIASILMRIGVRDSVYFDFLSAQARNALASDMPWAELFDKSTGKVTGVNPAFLEWCRKHGRDQQGAFDEARYKISIPWLYLASTGDPRIYDLLLDGLHAENRIIIGLAAFGLAKLQNPKAIDELIAASSPAIGDARFQIGIALWYFPDPKAQAAADKIILDFLPDIEAKTGKKIPLATLRSSYVERGTKDILNFQGLLPPQSALLPR